MISSRIALILIASLLRVSLHQTCRSLTRSKGQICDGNSPMALMLVPLNSFYRTICGLNQQAGHSSFEVLVLPPSDDSPISAQPLSSASLAQKFSKLCQRYLTSGSCCERYLRILEVFAFSSLGTIEWSILVQSNELNKVCGAKSSKKTPKFRV